MFINLRAGREFPTAGLDHGSMLSGEIAMEILIRELILVRMGRLRPNVVMGLVPRWLPGVSFPE